MLGSSLYCFVYFNTPLFSLPDDPLFSLLYLWTHWGHPEFSVPPGGHQEDVFPVPSAPGLYVSGLHWDRRLYPVFLAHLPTGELRAEKDVLGEGAFPASLARDG